MSRADLLSAAATLLVGGMAYFISGKTAALIAIGVGVVIVLTIHLIGKSTQELSPVQQPLAQASITHVAKATNSGNISNTSTFNPVNTFNPVIVLPNNPAPVKEEVRPETPRRTPDKPKRIHNIKCVSAQVMWISMQMDRSVPLHFFETRKDGYDAGIAAVATFRNSAMPEGVKPSEISNIRAHIVYLDRNGAEIGYGNASAAWLDDFWNDVNFPIGDPKTAVIAMFADGFMGTVQNKRSNLNTNPYGNSRADDYVTTKIAATYAVAEVQLLTYTGEMLFSQKFELDCTQPSIKQLDVADPKSLKCRTIKLRDELKQFQNELGPKPTIERNDSMTSKEYVHAGLNVVMPWVDKMSYGYERRFTQDVRNLYLEFGERGLLPGFGLDLPERVTTEDELQKIIDGLDRFASKLAD